MLSLNLGQLFTVAIVDCVKLLENFDWNPSNGNEKFSGLYAPCKEDAEGVLPALPILRVGLWHCGKTIEQNVENFCVGFVGVFLAKFFDEFSELLGGFGCVGFESVNSHVSLNIAYNACDGGMKVHLDFGLVRHSCD